MSIIAIRWAYSQPISSPVAKNVLVFLCTHDFPGNTSVFKITTICKATGYSDKPVRNALTKLHQSGYIDKQERFGENGEKTSNSYTILIPREYVQKFTEDYDLLTPPRSERPGVPVGETGGYRSERPDNKNKSFKYNIKKSFSEKEKKKNNSVDNSLKERAEMRKENEKKHDFADSMDQMANEKKHIEESEKHKRAPMPDALREKIDRMKGKRGRVIDADNAVKPKKATEFLAGTAVQPEIPPRSLSDEQGAAIDAGGCKDIPPAVRSADGLLAARRLCPRPKKTRVAGSDRVHFNEKPRRRNARKGDCDVLLS